MTYSRKTMTIRWQSDKGGVYTRRVDVGHVRDDANLMALAVLNVGNRGSVLSFEVETVQS